MTTGTAYAPEAADLAAYTATEQHTAPDRVTLSQATGAHLAAGDRDLITGVAVCKPGVFNGVFEVTRDDLDAWVTRFDELLGTFRPPMRLDHSWDILSVIGRFEALRVENRPDESLGGTVVPMLVGDVRLVGTKAENDQIREWIKTGKLRERSSEFWAYRTNAGADYPSVFAGCAFVDIPAVEGLGSITLRREAATLASDGTTTGVATVTTDTTPAPTASELGVDEVVGTPPPADEPTVEEPTADEAVEDEPAVEEEEADPVVVGDDPADEPVVEEPTEDGNEDANTALAADPDLVAALAAAGVTLDRRQAQLLEAEVTRRTALRIEADTRIAEFTRRGVIPLAARPQVEALLRHSDATVRDGLAALLSVAVSPVELRAKIGAHTTTLAAQDAHEDGTLTPQELSELDREEFGKAWAALTTDQRSKADYLAAYNRVVLGKTA